MYNLTAKQIGNDLILEYWDTPEPELSINSKENHSEIEFDVQRNNPKYLEWLSSKKTVKVYEDYKKKFKNTLISMRADGQIFYDWLIDEALIKGGVKCDVLKDRIEIVQLSERNNFEWIAILKPKKTLEETQDELWDEYKKIKYFFDEQEAKSQFIIKRKQK